MRIAILENNVVVNIIVVPQGYVPGVDEVDITGQSVGIGYKYANGVFTAPPAPTPAPIRRLTKLQFINRFSRMELVGIITAARTDAQAELFLRMLDWVSVEPDGTSVNLDDPATVEGVNALVGATRAAEILA